MKSAYTKKQHIVESKISIYEQLHIEDKRFLNNSELEYLLKKYLSGLSTAGLPNRTRSKVVKNAVCEALGYGIPKSFKKTQPRFYGQNFDTYVQKSLNLQIWNEEISANRRYVLIRVSEDDVITNVKVIDGVELSKLDTTGTLTQKYQARIKSLTSSPDIFSQDDSDTLKSLMSSNASLSSTSPSANPTQGSILSLGQIAEKLKPLIGIEFDDTGRDQDRNRGAIIHSKVCKALGYSTYEDSGQFPDILNQLLEVKLQLSPTIDLGLVLPSGQEPFISIGTTPVRHCDVRYVVFIAKQEDNRIRIENFAIGIGKDFLSKFSLFEGKVLNKKIQIPLPRKFFDD